MIRLSFMGRAAVALLLVQAAATTGYGQQLRRYQPARPTVSPYLNLLRNDNASGVPNYYGLVRPQLQQQAINRQQGVLQAQQSAAITALAQRFEAGVTPTGKGAQFMVPGSRATFQNTSRYYQQPRAVRRR